MIPPIKGHRPTSLYRNLSSPKLNPDPKAKEIRSMNTGLAIATVIGLSLVTISGILLGLNIIALGGGAAIMTVGITTICVSAIYKMTTSLRNTINQKREKKASIANQQQNLNETQQKKISYKNSCIELLQKCQKTALSLDEHIEKSSELAQHLTMNNTSLERMTESLEKYVNEQKTVLQNKKDLLEEEITEIEQKQKEIEQKLTLTKSNITKKQAQLDKASNLNQTHAITFLQQELITLSKKVSNQQNKLTDLLKKYHSLKDQAQTLIPEENKLRQAEITLNKDVLKEENKKLEHVNQQNKHLKILKQRVLTTKTALEQQLSLLDTQQQSDDPYESPDLNTLASYVWVLKIKAPQLPRDCTPLDLSTLAFPDN